jgi:flagellar biosynthesis protein FlhF
MKDRGQKTEMASKTKNFRLTRVEAPTMQEALQKIRAQLGSEAMIVSSRTFRRGGVLGVGAQEVVEVYAADTRSRIENIRRENSNRLRLPDPPAGEGEEAPRVPPAPSAVDPPPAPAPSVRGVNPGGESYQAFSSAIGQIRQDIRDLMSRAAEGPKYGNAFLRECHDTLAAREVDPRVTDLIVDEISKLRIPAGYPDPSRVRAVVRSQLTKLFVASQPFDERKRPRIIVLVGPTGVGKTTTIAKLAARAKLSERRRVGLITLDTFRIAAVDQLEKYAEIIGLPLIVATSPKELETAVDELRAKEMDVVFIDSAGRSHRDELKMAELREFLAVLPDAEVHLVLSTTTHGKTILSIANRFSGIGFHKVILTKVDETISFGSFVSALISIGRPVSFVTDGQNVPDDIVASDPERLADLVLKVNAL